MIYAANWKMHKTPDEARSYFQELKSKSTSRSSQYIFFVPAPCWSVAAEELAGTRFQWGAQNCYFKTSGAFTGENSPEELKSMGATHLLIGHSERRQFFGESDEHVALKAMVAQNQNLIPVVCIGETEFERESGQTEMTLRRQIEVGLKSVDKTKPLVIAYEPVWAIGTGKVATPETAQATHAYIRSFVGKDTPILYGGSVKPDNSKALASQPDIDGFLVGGASLTVDIFLAL